MAYCSINLLLLYNSTTSRSYCYLLNYLIIFRYLSARINHDLPGNNLWMDFVLADVQQQQQQQQQFIIILHYVWWWRCLCVRTCTAITVLLRTVFRYNILLVQNILDLGLDSGCQLLCFISFTFSGVRVTFLIQFLFRCKPQ